MSLLNMHKYFPSCPLPYHKGILHLRAPVHTVFLALRTCTCSSLSSWLIPCASLASCSAMMALWMAWAVYVFTSKSSEEKSA